MSIYMFPNSPIIIKSGDKILFPFTNSIEEVNLLTLGVNRCRIQCYRGSDGYGQGSARSAHYVSGEVYVTNLIAAGITKLYAVVGASASGNYSGFVAVRDSVPNNSGHFNGGRSELRTDRDNAKSAIISSSGASSNYFTNVKGGNGRRLSAHGYIVITALEDGYKQSNYQLQTKTTNGIKNFPLYQGEPPVAIRNLDVKLPNGEKAFAITSSSGQPLDGISLKNPALNHVVKMDDGSGSGGTSGGGYDTSSNVVPAGIKSIDLGGFFQVPPNITTVLIRFTYRSSASPNARWQYWAGYVKVVPGQIISTNFFLHFTYYDHDLSFHFFVNDSVEAGIGRIPPTRSDHGPGWAWLGPTTIEYSPAINARGGWTLPTCI